MRHFFALINLSILKERTILRSERKNYLSWMPIQSKKQCVHFYVMDQLIRIRNCSLMSIHQHFSNPNFAPFILQLINHFSIPYHQIVLEIVEHESIKDFSALINVLHHLKSMGLLIAVDDFGKGMDNINRKIEIDSDYIKLDRYFSIGLNGSKKKQAYVDFLVHYCARFNLKLIFEGLETERDIDCARILGVQYAQGYAIGKPQLISQFM